MAKLFKGNELMALLKFVGGTEIVKVDLNYDSGESDVASVITNYLKMINTNETNLLGTLFVFTMHDDDFEEGLLSWVISEDGGLVVTNLYTYYICDLYSTNIQRIQLSDINALKTKVATLEQETNTDIEDLQKQIDDNDITIETQRKEIENLKSANEGKTFSLWTETGLQQITPLNALPYAYLKIIAGYSAANGAKMVHANVSRIVSHSANGEVIDTLEIPKEILELEGYGMANSSSLAVTNYIDFETMTYYQNCAELILDGSDDELWETRPDYANLDRYAINAVTHTTNKGACSIDFVYVKSLNDNLGFVINNNGTQIIVNFAEKGTTTLAQFKAWLKENPITIVYRLATPIVKDISHIKFNPFIKVEANGIVEFETESTYQSNKSEIWYQTKVV